MNALLLLVLTQTAPPLVAASNEEAAPRVERANGEVCVVEPLPEGGEARHCRAASSDYAGQPLDAPVIIGHPAPVAADPKPSQLGFALALGGAVPLAHSSASGVHARLGVRYALLSREQNPGRFNVAVSLLTGGDTERTQVSAAFEARLEATWGGHRRFLEPTLDVFLSGGVQHLNYGMTPELYAGAGISLDLLFSRLFDTVASDSPATVLAPFSVAPQFALAVLFLLSPTVEYRYAVRGDGSAYSQVLISIGL